MSNENSSDQDDKNWAAYYAKLKDRPPRHTAIFAARRFETPGFAVDLGCGAGRDALPLLAQGWRVLAIDKQPSAIFTLRATAPPPLTHLLETQNTAFETADWEQPNLIISSFALPLAPRHTFSALWNKIWTSLVPGGRFAGQLYGERDTWVQKDGPDGLIGFTRAECLDLLGGQKIELFEEEEHPGVTPRGRSKHWHIFHIVAQKP